MKKILAWAILLSYCPNAYANRSMFNSCTGCPDYTLTTFGSSTDTTFGNNPYVVINTSGSAEGLLINVYGQPSGGVQNQLGALTIRSSTTAGPPATLLVLTDSTTDTQGGSGLLEIWSNNPNHNDPKLWFHVTGHDSSPEIRDDAFAPNWEMINKSTDTAHGLGKWEPAAIAYQGINLQINSRSGDNSTFEHQAHWIPLQRGGGLQLYAPTTANGDPFYGTAAPLQWETTDQTHTVGLKGPAAVTTSFYFTLPSTFNNANQIMYQKTNGPERRWEFTTDGTAGQVLSLSASSTPTWSTPTGTPSGASYTYQYKNTLGGLTGGSASYDANTGGLIVGTTNAIELADISNTHYVGFRASDTLPGSTIWVLPENDGSAGDLLGTTGNIGGIHTLYWITPTGTPGGSTNSLQYRTSGGAFNGAEKIFRDASTGGLSLQTTGQAEFFEAANDHYVGFRAQDSGMTGSTIWQLPLVDGSANQFLQTGGAPNHVLSWTGAVVISTSGHALYGGSTPSVGTCGSSPSISGNDNAGTITVGGGVVTACTLTFASPWSAAPVCVLSTNSTAVTGDISSISNTAAAFGFSATLGGGQIYYHCFGTGTY